MLKKKTEQLNLYKLPNDIEIYHTGYSTSIVKQKLARNLKILQEEIALSGEKSWHSVSLNPNFELSFAI